LYDEVGIKTIVLDPDKKAASNEEKASLLNDFMFTIATLASPNCKIAGQKDKTQFFSAALANLLSAELDQFEKGGPPTRFGRNSKSRRVPLALSDMLEVAGKRTIPAELQPIVRQIIDRCVAVNQKGNRQLPSDYIPLAISYSKTFGVDPLVTFVVASNLGRGNSREMILNDSVPWNNIWAAKLTPDQVGWILKKLESEIEAHEDNPQYGLDHDLAFIVDPVKRVLSGEIFESGNSETTRKANELVQRVAQLYPSVLNYTPTPSQRPDPSQIIQEIDEREAAMAPPEEPPDDEVPF
jgi:hypothetical protein